MKSLDARHAGTGGIRRIARSELAKAIEGLNGRGALSDSRVHEVRKRLKRVRAALRLLRESLGERSFRRWNRALRDAARPLSATRDAAILGASFAGLVAKAPVARRRALRAAGSSLSSARGKRSAAAAGARLRRQALPGLRRVERALGRWRPERTGASVLGPGLRATYRRGRKAFAAAGREPADVALHEWRKQVKYFWHQAEMLEPVRPAVMRAWKRDAHRLATLLGDDHDLALLRRRVRGSGKPGSRREEIVALLDARRAILQARARALGARFYAEPPMRIETRFRRWWRAWRAVRG